MELSNLNLQARLKELKDKGEGDSPTYHKIAKLLAANIAAAKKKSGGKINIQAQETAARKEYTQKGVTPTFRNIQTSLSNYAAQRREKEIKQTEVEAYMKKLGISREEAEFRLKNKKNKE